MEANGVLDGTGEAIPCNKVLDGTDLELAYDLQADDLVLRVNKAGVLVFRAKLRNAVPEMLESRLVHFNSFAPDLMFTIGDSEEGLSRMLAAGGMTPAAGPPKGGFIRWLLGRA